MGYVRSRISRLRRPRRAWAGRHRRRQQRHALHHDTDRTHHPGTRRHIRSSEPVHSTHPRVAVNDRGDVAWSGQASTTTALPTFVSGGSAEARQIIDSHSECDPNNPQFSTQSIDHLTVSSSEESVTLPVLCSPAGLTWINDRELVVSVGDEGVASLVRVTRPADSSLVAQSTR